MYLDKAVMIPKRKGVSFKSKGDTNYVIYEIGRKYDPEKQYTVPERVQIGIQIPAEPEMMLPNENYLKHFYNEMGNPYEEETGLEGKPMSTGGGTYAKVLKQGVAFGALFPDEEDLAHQADEYADIDRLMLAMKIYANALIRLAAEPMHNEE